MKEKIDRKFLVTKSSHILVNFKRFLPISQKVVELKKQKL